jgi:hypothetical protein
MIEVPNIKKVEKSFKALNGAFKKIVALKGKDIVKEVKKTPKKEGTPLSPNNGMGQPREALYEAVYKGQIQPTAANLSNAKKAKSEMTPMELTSEEEAIVDRYIRDLMNNLFKDV